MCDFCLFPLKVSLCFHLFPWSISCQLQWLRSPTQAEPSFPEPAPNAALKTNTVYEVMIKVSSGLKLLVLELQSSFPMLALWRAAEIPSSLTSLPPVPQPIHPPFVVVGKHPQLQLHSDGIPMLGPGCVLGPTWVGSQWNYTNTQEERFSSFNFVMYKNIETH